MAIPGILLRAVFAGIAHSCGVVTAGVIGGAVLCGIVRWGLLPSVNPVMALVPQIACFLAHLLFGLVTGAVLAVAFRRCGVLGAVTQ